MVTWDHPTLLTRLLWGAVVHFLPPAWLTSSTKTCYLLLVGSWAGDGQTREGREDCLCAAPLRVLNLS